MSEHAVGRANQVRTPGLLGSESDDDRGRIGERHAADHGRPSCQWRTLQAKETEQAEDAAKEALDGGAFPQLLDGPSGWQTGPVLRSLGIPGDNGYRSERRMDPGDQAETPIAGIQPNDAGAQPIEAHGSGEQGLGKGSVMTVGGGEEEEQRQAGAAAEQCVDAIAQQQGTRVVVRSMTKRRIGVGAPPS